MSAAIKVLSAEQTAPLLPVEPRNSSDRAQCPLKIESNMLERIVYLAGPYTHDDPLVREERFHKITRAAAHLIESGAIVYSPLTMTHPIDLELAAAGETMGSEYWVRFDEAFMEFCDCITVLRIEGWDNSSGVMREIEFFESKGNYQQSRAHARDVWHSWHSRRTATSPNFLKVDLDANALIPKGCALSAFRCGH